jgi:hypothetical protein
MSRQDQVSYDVQQLELLLPAVWDDEFGILASRAEQERSSKADPSHGNNIVVMVADVKRAWDSLTKWDHEVLEARYYYGLGFSAIAELAGLESEQEAADDVDLAIAKMIEFLNGRVL